MIRCLVKPYHNAKAKVRTQQRTTKRITSMFIPDLSLSLAWQGHVRIGCRLGWTCGAQPAQEAKT